MHCNAAIMTCETASVNTPKAMYHVLIVDNMEQGILGVRCARVCLIAQVCACTRGEVLCVFS